QQQLGDGAIAGQEAYKVLSQNIVNHKKSFQSDDWKLFL
ncbi:hypothetical protein AMCSP01_001455, partial [Streptococcus pneumoniae 2061376]